MQLTAAIRAQAQALGFNPALIQNWLRNNVEWTPTAGGHPKRPGQAPDLELCAGEQADADLIASFLPKPHADGSPIQPSELPTSLPGYLIRLKAQINLDGQVVAQSTQAVQMGADLLSTGGFT